MIDPVMNDVIHIIQEEAKERLRGYKQEKKDTRTAREKIDDLHPKLYDYAKQKFPLMSDELIYKNAQEFLFNMEHNGQLDGHIIGMHLNRNTGIVMTHIFIRGDEL